MMADVNIKKLMQTKHPPSLIEQGKIKEVKAR